MKLQHLTVIFIIIIVPITLVVSAYMGTHIKTIQRQSQYTSHLINSTYDGMRAFQLNTFRNNYSTIGNSKIRDVEAAISAYYNSLKTSMGSSGYTEEELKEYTPAIIFSLYEGYYIYTKYNEYNGVESTEDNNYVYGLKPFIHYSCRYKKGSDFDFTVDYTLDNTITIMGNVNNKYVTVSGHLISKDYSTIPTMTDEVLEENLIIMADDGNPEKEDPNTHTPLTEKFRYIIYNNDKVYLESPGQYFRYNTSQYRKDYVTSADDLANLNDIYNNANYTSKSAQKYYDEAKEFTNWVYTNLKDITVNNVVDAGGNSIDTTTYFATDMSGKKIFDTSSLDNNPLISSSLFNQHRMDVIRKSIETNLIATIANYNHNSDKGFEAQLPIFSEDQWYKIENNICMTTFLQGLPIGGKLFNNYSVVANNANKEAISNDSVYIIAKAPSGQSEYHKIGCKELLDNWSNYQIIGAYANTDFKRRSVSLIGEDANAYKQLTGANANDSAFYFPQAYPAGYSCAVNTTQNYSIDDIIAGNVAGVNNQSVNELRTIYLRALARVRYDLYYSYAYFPHSM